MNSDHLTQPTGTAESRGKAAIAKLTKPQAELLAAMKAGTICHYMGGMACYYFRNDTMRRCTSQVRALLARGLVEAYDEDWRGHKVRATTSA
jgi:hypothetical protein